MCKGPAKTVCVLGKHQYEKLQPFPSELLPAFQELVKAALFLQYTGLLLLELRNLELLQGAAIQAPTHESR